MDQRRFPRAKYKCVVKLRQAGPGVPIASETENIGMGGICVLLERGLDIFAPVDLEIFLEDTKPPVRVGGTVVWVVRRGDIKRKAAFDTGVEFTDIAPEDKARIEAVLDKSGAR
jgi:Tfp pilus assembly protein PilZ